MAKATDNGTSAAGPTLLSRLVDLLDDQIDDVMNPLLKVEAETDKKALVKLSTARGKAAGLSEAIATILNPYAREDPEVWKMAVTNVKQDAVDRWKEDVGE